MQVLEREDLGAMVDELAVHVKHEMAERWLLIVFA